MLSIDKTQYQVDLTGSFDFLSDEYADLFACSSAHAFQHPIWLEAFYRHIAPNRGAKPQILTVRRSTDGALQCVLPLILRTRYGFRLLETTDLGVSDYASPVAAPDFWADLERDGSLQGEICKALPKFDLMRVRPVRDEDCAHYQLLLGCDPKPLDFCAHAVPLDQPYADWRKATLNGSLRKMIDRKTRKLRREHDVEIQELTEAGAIAQAITNLAHMRSGRFDGDVIQQDFAVEFYREIAVHGARNGLASTWQLSADGETLGYVFGLTHAGRYYYLLIGCDYERFGQFSPGLQLYDGIMEGWLDRGGTWFDFTIGDEDFKMKFGTSPTSMYVLMKPASLLGMAAMQAMKWRR
ncbi:GNAT family N-acetyltransferase [Hoeflea sp. TYP-13]|uniref:GNAT family N-acetyltransferase n=1 Tax=Hoeflea sp. TYP-13 TaxID=3230023 RepID=UPI0034C6257F